MSRLAAAKCKHLGRDGMAVWTGRKVDHWNLHCTMTLSIRRQEDQPFPFLWPKESVKAISTTVIDFEPIPPYGGKQME
jgi:hypothetical protein